MSVERKHRLDAIGFVWDPLEEAWEEGFAALMTFKEREGHCAVPRRLHRKGTLRLGTWVITQRNTKDTMSNERRERLDKIGFVWDPLEEAWEEGFAALMTFKEREGRCNVPPLHREGTFSLGTWVLHQRANKDKMSNERRKRLDDIGFVWVPNKARWEDGFSALEKFKEREGRCNVLHSHREGTLQLGNWVAAQRTAKDKMSAERRKRLDKIGFVWAKKL